MLKEDVLKFWQQETIKERKRSKLMSLTFTVAATIAELEIDISDIGYTSVAGNFEAEYGECYFYVQINDVSDFRVYFEGIENRFDNLSRLCEWFEERKNEKDFC